MNTMIATSLTTILQVNMIKGDGALPDLKETLDSCKSQGELVDGGIKNEIKGCRSGVNSQDRNL